MKIVILNAAKDLLREWLELSVEDPSVASLPQDDKRRLAPCD